MIGKIQWVVLFSLMALWGGAYPEFKPREVPIPREGTFSASAIDCGRFQEKVEKMMENRAKGRSLDALLRERELLKLFMISDMIRTAGADRLTALTGRAPKYSAFLNCFWRDIEWMTLYAGAGVVPTGTEVGIRVLADIWARDGQTGNFRDFLNLSTGIAAAWGAGSTSTSLQNAEHSREPASRCSPVWRYFFFKQSWLSGDLQPGFMALRPWEIRFLAGTLWSDASLAWLQARVNLPPDEWGRACGLVPYTGYSQFGYTIQGPLFYLPFSPQMGRAQKAAIHGGVCGSLSTTGSNAAISRGWPSYTCGQPGHCAYAYRMKRGSWRGGNGGPAGSPKIRIFPGRAPSAVNLMEAFFADDRRVDLYACLLAVARGAERVGLDLLARSAWERILKELPLNPYGQLEFQRYAQRKALFGRGGWSSYSERIMKAYANHGYQMLSVLAPVEERILAEKSPEERVAWYLAVEEILCSAPSSWANEDGGILNRALAACGQDPELELKFLKGLLRLQFRMKNTQTLGDALEWSVRVARKRGGEKFLKELLEGLVYSGKRGEGKHDREERERLSRVYGQAILAAEKIRSPEIVSLFSTYAVEAGIDRGFDPGKKVALLPGRLVSKGALVIPSKESKADRPCAHYKVGSNADGAIVTGKESSPSIIMQLPAAERVTGVIIVQRRKSAGHLKVSRSVDGATWFPLLEDERAPVLWRTPLGQGERMRWVKVELVPKGKKGVLALRNLLLFAE